MRYPSGDDVNQSLTILHQEAGGHQWDSEVADRQSVDLESRKSLEATAIFSTVSREEDKTFR